MPWTFFPRADKISHLQILDFNKKGVEFRLNTELPLNCRQGNPKQGSLRVLSGKPSVSMVLGFGCGGSLLSFLGASMIVNAHERLRRKPFDLAKENNTLTVSSQIGN